VSTIEEIDPATANELVERGDALLVDVRNDDEWAIGHAPAAVHLPLGDLHKRHPELPTDRRIVVICRSGARSARATEALVGAGYDVVNLTGGMQAWAALGLPVVTETGDPGAVA
jgi:rhodanese-related sulfurtransferase